MLNIALNRTSELSEPENTIWVNTMP